MRPHTAFKSVPAIALAALAAACSSMPQGAPMQQPASARQLQAYDWDLAAAFDGQGRPAPSWRLPNHAPTRLHFQARQLSVQNLCNAIGAGYTVDGERLALAPARKAYVHVVRGALHVNGQALAAGDAALLADEAAIALDHGRDAEVLVFDLAP